MARHERESGAQELKSAAQIGQNEDDLNEIENDDIFEPTIEESIMASGLHQQAPADPE